MLRAVIDLNTWRLGFSFSNDKVNLHISPGAYNWDLEIENKGGSLPRFYTDWPPRKIEVVLLLLKILFQLGWAEERASLLQSGRLEIRKAENRFYDRAVVFDQQCRPLATVYRNELGGFLSVSLLDDLGFLHSGIKARPSKQIVQKLILEASERAANYLSWYDYIAILAAIGKLPKEGEEDSCAKDWQFYPLESEHRPGKTYWFPPSSAQGAGKRV